MIPQEELQRWQLFWKRLLDMTYYRKGIETELFAEQTDGDYDNIILWNEKTDQIMTITFDRMWRAYSELRNDRGVFLDPQPVPELRHLYVPRILFECLGVYTFFRVCFPNCIISFWEPPK